MTTCERKRRFRDRIAAEMAIQRIATRGVVTDKDPVRAYRCPDCRGWHLTSRRVRGSA